MSGQFLAFFNTPTGALVYLVLLAAFADFGVGVWAALRDGTFELSALAAFVRKHLLGRVAPIFGLLALGYAAGLVPTPEGLASFAPAAFTLAGSLAALAYIGETFGSVMADLRKQPEAELTDAEKAAGVQLLTAKRIPED